MGKQKSMLEAAKLKYSFCQSHKTWSFPILKARDLVILCVKIRGIWPAWELSQDSLSAFYFLISNTKFYVKLQNLTIKLPCYQICNVSATQALKVLKKLCRIIYSKRIDVEMTIENLYIKFSHFWVFFSFFSERYDYSSCLFISLLRYFFSRANKRFVQKY